MPMPDRITLHLPDVRGGFTQIRKFPMAVAGHFSTPEQTEVFVEHRETGEGRRDSLTCATPDGEVRYRVPIGDNENLVVGWLQSNAAGTRAYVKTDRDLSAYDTATGACVGSIARITPDHTLELLPQIDGEAVVLTNKTVMFTNANLEELGWRAYPWEVRGYEILPDGGTVAVGAGDFYHLGNVEISHKGSVTFASEQVRSCGIARLPDGRLQLLEYDAEHAIAPSTPENRRRADSLGLAATGMSLVTVDPQRGEVARVATARGANAVLPLANRTTLVCSLEQGTTFTQHGDDGSVLRSYAFENEGGATNFLVDDARDQAYVVLRTSAASVVYRLDLSPTAVRHEPVEVARASENLIVLPVFSDGRLAVASRDGVRVYDGDHVTTHASLAAFKDAVGDPTLQPNTVLVETYRARGGICTRQPERTLLADYPWTEQTRLDDWLPVIEAEIPALQQSGPLASDTPAGRPVAGTDGCLDFTRRVDSDTALRDMRLGDERVYAQMVMHRQVPAIGLMTFPGQVGRIEVWPDKIKVRLPDERETKEVDTRGDHATDRALPVKVGDDCFIVTGSHGNLSPQNALWWTHPASGRSKVYDVSQPITGLYSSPDAVYAVGSYGAILTIEPVRERGEQIESDAPLSTVTAAGTSSPCKPIVETDETVSIGGVIVRKRKPGAS